MTPPDAGTDAILRARLGPVDPSWRTRAGLRDAAVLAVLLAREGGDRLLLTERRDDLPDHPGQVAFPGGAREGTEDALACALRETEEEVGLPDASVAILGRLPDRVSVAGFFVACFVGRAAPPAAFRPDPREVTGIFETPLALLRDESRWRYEDRTTPRGTFRRVPFFEGEGPLLWGLTAMFVRDLIGALDADQAGR
jgi:8-oxo-dGTP pyrophosphatase MutT (NUDIX family)